MRPAWCPDEQMRDRVSDDPGGLNYAIRELVGAHMGAPALALTLDMKISTAVGADSLDRLELIMTAEEAFHVRIPSDRLAAIETIGDLAAVVGELGGTS